jgi:DNA topoisomerase-1
MEDSLDAVASGEQEWVPLLERFWKPFIDLVTHTETSVSREEVAQARELGVDPVSGKPMTVRMGRFGPFVQIGTKDDEEKPKFAGLRPGQKMDLITFAEAIELFKLPRKLGLTAAGEEIIANTGRFGPYVKYGAKYVSLKTDDPYEISPERALEVIREKEIADANRLILDFPDAKIQVLNGRYGPYITDKERNAKIPKDKDPKSLTLEECQTLLAAAPVRSFGKWGKKNAKGGAKRVNGKAAAAVSGAAAAADKSAAASKPRGARKAANPVAGATTPALAPPVKLAAKASKSAVNKKAPAQPVSKAVKAVPAVKMAAAKPAAGKAKTPKSSATHKR